MHAAVSVPLLSHLLDWSRLTLKSVKIYIFGEVYIRILFWDHSSAVSTPSAINSVQNNNLPVRFKYQLVSLAKHICKRWKCSCSMQSLFILLYILNFWVTKKSSVKNKQTMIYINCADIMRINSWQKKRAVTAECPTVL